MLSLILHSLFCYSLISTLAATIDMEGLPDTGLDTSGWTAGVLPSLSDIWDLNDIQIAAKNVLSEKYYGPAYPLFSSLSSSHFLQLHTALEL